MRPTLFFSELKEEPVKLNKYKGLMKTKRTIIIIKCAL